jgi:RNA polymerase sigma-70 factor (ECF subfamily)
MRNISEETIRKAAAGDIGAFREIYERAGAYVHTVAYAITGFREDSEEVTQDVFLSIYRNLPKFRFRSSFKTWLYRITVNKAINRARKRRRKTGRDVPYDKGLHDIGVKSKRHDERLADVESNRALIESMLSCLSPEQKSCIVLRAVEDMSYKEISDTLGININTVRSRLKRAREKMVESLGSRENVK